MAPPTPSLIGIPPELLTEIMCNLRAVYLLPLISTCKFVHDCFKASETYILNECINREIDPEVRFEAFVNFEAFSNRTIPCRLWRQEFMQKYLERREISLKVVDLSQAAGMSQLHHRVLYFTEDFIDKALAKRPSSWEASPTELARFQRAFYHFDLLTNLFHRVEWSDWTGHEADMRIVDQDTTEFFNFFSPTESHQLSCVFDYFLGLLAPIANEFATHDVEWGKHDAEVIDWEVSPIAVSRVSFGISRIANIVCAKSYEDRYQAFGSPNLIGQGFISRGLTKPYHWPTLPQTQTAVPLTLSQITPALEELLCPTPFYKDPDGGPEYAWRWTNQFSTIRFLTYQTAHHGLRQWAYVMWDKKRIDAWGDIGPQVTQRTWNEPRRLRGNTRQEFAWNNPHLSRNLDVFMHAAENWSRDHNAIRLSAIRRKEIFEAGGRGWWSEEDESRVVWEEGKPSPWDGLRARSLCRECFRDYGAGRCPAHELILKVPGGSVVLGGFHAHARL